MFALVTCHIFPSQSDTEKKWIPGTWLPGWQLAVFQSPRLHECGPADAHGNAQPFCMDKCIFRKKRLFCNLATRWNKILQFVPSFPIYGWLTWWCDFFPVGPAFEDHPQEFGQKKGPAPWILFLTPAPRPLQGTFFWLVKLNICGCTPFARTNVFSEKKTCFASWSHFFGWNIFVCTLLQNHVKNHTHSINHGTFFLGFDIFRYVLVNSHLVHPPSNSWLLALGILQTYPLSESFMIDFLMPYIHRLIDQPTLNHNRQKLISCHCTSGSFQEKKSGPFLVWYFIPGPISCPGTLTHCLLDFWKIVFFKKCTEPPGKKNGSTEGGYIYVYIYIYRLWSTPLVLRWSPKLFYLCMFIPEPASWPSLPSKSFRLRVLSTQDFCVAGSCSLEQRLKIHQEIPEINPKKPPKPKPPKPGKKSMEWFRDSQEWLIFNSFYE